MYLSLQEIADRIISYVNVFWKRIAPPKCSSVGGKGAKGSWRSLHCFTHRCVFPTLPRLSGNYCCLLSLISIDHLFKCFV